MRTSVKADLIGYCVCVVAADTLLLLRVIHSFAIFLILIPLFHQNLPQFSAIEIIDLKFEHNVQNGTSSRSNFLS